MKNKDIVFLRICYLRGPNIWTYRPVIEAWVDIGAFEELPSNKLPGFTDRLLTLLPGLHQHRCGVGEPGGFVQRLREGTWLGHVLEHVTIELQNLAGSQVGFGKARQTAEGSGIYKVVVRSRDERVGRMAIAAARELILSAVDDHVYDLAPVLIQLRQLVDRHCLGPSTACIVDAALERKIPNIRLNDGNLVQLGYGTKQRRIWTAETDRTSAIAESISRDKDLTKTLLAACGIPVPQGRIVESGAEAWEAAEDIGLPVVVKPVDGNHGRGVSLELDNKAEVEAAFLLAESEGSEVIVERFIQGDEHRLLVVGGRVVAAARGEKLFIVGDGSATVRQLIDMQINSDPRRGEEEEFPLETIDIEKDDLTRLLLQRQGYEADSIPMEGVRVLIQRNGNVAIDCTDDVCPQVEAVAALASRVIGLDIAGIDVVAETLSRPLEIQGGAIVEVNAGPGLLMHLKPEKGRPRPVGEAIAEQLFPSGDAGRIPVVGVSGGCGGTQAAQLIAWIVQLSGRHVGLACTDGVFIDRRRIGLRNPLSYEGAQSILMNRIVETVVIESNPRCILTDGFPYDRCQVGVVTGVAGAEDLSEFYINDEEHLFTVLRTQVDLVLPEGVAILSVTDPGVVEMAGLCDGEVIFYGVDGEQSVLVDHRAGGGRVVFIRGGCIVMATGASEVVLRRLAILENSDSHLLIENIVAAAAASWGLGIAIDLIGAGIETYDESHTRLQLRATH